MKKAQKRINIDFKKVVKWIVVIILSCLSGAGLDLAIRPTENGLIVDASYKIELPAVTVLETEDGEIEVIGATTVENVDSMNSTALMECGENEEECGMGTFYYAPVDTPYAFYDYTKNQCWNTDGAYGAQCWDYGDLFFQNYAGRRLSTCGTGAAKGTWEGDCKYVNAGDDFTLIYDKTKLQPGDWAVFNNGTWGHIGMVMGYYDNGYILLAGQNQGGSACEGGGAAVNVIKISLGSFSGAFRPNSYIKPEPKPEPIPISGCVIWHVERGDTMSKIMMDCEGTIQYGEIMNEYAKTWYSLIYKPNQSVYDGWNSPSGVGLYAGDDIEHRF